MPLLSTHLSLLPYLMRRKQEDSVGLCRRDGTFGCAFERRLEVRWDQPCPPTKGRLTNTMPALFSSHYVVQIVYKAYRVQGLSHFLICTTPPRPFSLFRTCANSKMKLSSSPLFSCVLWRFLASAWARTCTLLMTTCLRSMLLTPTTRTCRVASATKTPSTTTSAIARVQLFGTRWLVSVSPTLFPRRRPEACQQQPSRRQRLR